ncbi:thioesterase-like superfamily-domain-containing protein [Limtongia smithiae]|uniref:thioesterase-like superfamily-domain-containing protein n=1 Tax=Limtongia smithiae TaxID=1125753 RepID=UPI0034CDF79F
MTSPSEAPIERVLKLDQVAADAFRNAEPLYKPAGARGVFGGCVVSQSLMAAIKTVPLKYEVHSMHCYFILAGDSDIPIVYQVEHVREGRSYCTRTVEAMQNNRCIFTTTISFQLPAPDELTHAPVYPGPPLVPPPEQAIKYEDYVMAILKKGQISNRIAMLDAQSAAALPTEYRLVAPDTSEAPPQEKKQYLWVKARGKIQDPKAHAMALAYFSDNLFLGQSVRSHGIMFFDVSMMVSLDHIIYFHAPFKADEWLLYEMVSPWAGCGRGLSYGRLFSQDGTLVASVIQEGVVRLKKNAAAKAKM